MCCNNETTCTQSCQRSEIIKAVLDDISYNTVEYQGISTVKGPITAQKKKKKKKKKISIYIYIYKIIIVD